MSKFSQFAAACAAVLLGFTAVADFEMNLEFCGDKAKITVPAGIVTLPVRLELVCNEHSAVVAESVSPTGGVFEIGLENLGVRGGSVEAALVTTCAVLDYVEGTGVQYIDLGIGYQVGTRVTMTAQYAAYAQGVQTAYGFSANGGCWFGCKDGRYFYGGGLNQQKSATDAMHTTALVYSGTQGQCYFDDSVTAAVGNVPGEGEVNPGGATLTVFATKGSTIGYFSQMKLAAFKVEQGVSVCADLVPVLDGGIAALYDRVTGVIYKDLSGNGFEPGETISAAGTRLAVSNSKVFTLDGVMAEVNDVNVEHDGAAHAASVTVIFPTSGATAKWAWSDDLTDFTHDEPEPFTEVGAHTNAVKVSASGLGDFVGRAIVTITPQYAYHLETEGSIAPITDWSLASGDAKPALTVTCNNVTLEEGVHYAVTFENANRPGFARAVVTGVGEACGKLSAEFFITDSAATGLRVSVLGDSYSTYGGISRTQSTFYPSGDVDAVGLTYWMRFAELLHGGIDIAYGWGGASVVMADNVGAGRSASFVSSSRLEALDDPDVLIVLGGANDIGTADRGSSLDCYDPEIQKRNLGLFRPAYAYLICELKARYPEAEIVCLFPAADETDSINSQAWLDAAPRYIADMEEIAAHYGVTGVKLHGMCRVYNNHPNAQGMENIARQAFAAYVDSHRTESGAIECEVDADGVVCGLVPCGLVAGKTADLVVAWDDVDRGTDAAAWTHRTKVGEVTAVGRRVKNVNLLGLGVGYGQRVRLMAVYGDATLSVSDAFLMPSGRQDLGLSVVGHEATVSVPAASVIAPSRVVIEWDEGASAVVADVNEVTETGGVFRADLSTLGVPNGATVRASLVAAYDVVDYIESTGTQYVDFGLHYADGTRVTMTAQYTDASESVQTAYGFSPNGCCWFGSKGGKYTVGGDISTQLASIDSLAAMRTSVFEYVKGGSHITIDGLSDEEGGNRNPGNATLTVFATKGSTLGYFSQMKLAAFTVEQGDTKIRCVPIRLDNGAGALLDTVTDHVYPSEGADPFLVGCVKVKGGAVLGRSSAEAYRPDVVQAVVTGANVCFDGDAHAAAVRVLYPDAAACTVAWAWSEDPTAFSHDAPEAFTDVGVYKTAVRVSCPGYETFEREVDVRVIEATAVRSLGLTCVGSRRLAIDWGPSFSRDSIYLVWDDVDCGVKTVGDWSNSRLLMTLDADSEPGRIVVDKPDGAVFVRVVAVANKYKCVESLTHTGTEVIDLGYLPTSRTGVEIDMEMKNLDGGSGAVPFFGTGNVKMAELGNANGTLWMIWYYGTSNSAPSGKRRFECWWTGNLNGVYLDAMLSDMKSRQTLSIDPVGNTISYGSQFYSLSGHKPDANLKYPLAIFGINASDGFKAWDTNNRCGVLTVYEVRIYEDGRLVRRFVPAVKDGKALMVDALDPTRLAENKGSGNFVIGKEVPCAEISSASEAIDLTKVKRGLVIFFH